MLNKLINKWLSGTLTRNSILMTIYVSSTH